MRSCTQTTPCVYAIVYDCVCVCARVCHILLPFEKDVVHSSHWSPLVSSEALEILRNLGPEMDLTLTNSTELHLTLRSGLVRHNAVIIDFFFSF